MARRCFGTKWYSDVPGEYPRWCDTGNEDITDIGAATARVARSAKICYHTSIINAKKLYNSTLLSSNLQSYLSSRSFTVDINGIKSPPSKLLYGVPQGSVLGPLLLFILYTTPLSLIIPQSSVNHKLYADDTQLFLSFSAYTFSENILLLQNTITNILHGWPQTLECSTTLSSLPFSFFSISLSCLTIFFSIPQVTKNSPFSSFLSSLAYLLSTGLTPWNFDSACLSSIILSISFILDPFICSTRFNLCLSYSV